MTTDYHWHLEGLLDNEADVAAIESMITSDERMKRFVKRIQDGLTKQGVAYSVARRFLEDSGRAPELEALERRYQGTVSTKTENWSRAGDVKRGIQQDGSSSGEVLSAPTLDDDWRYR
ncbi:MAG: hypothetical protein CMH61_00720 [Nanoarchaeota archaeon]|nr:hypothetical protein [Nanoarchaeota archaeon]|tara:strand:- start:2617 stop:2970 length:354 start_codon:yes stop_codon:yes gene_type:complete